MIICEATRDVADSIDLVLHYSDCDVKILQVETGILYAAAVDTLPCRYTYVETDIPVEGQEDMKDNTIEIQEVIDNA